MWFAWLMRLASLYHEPLVAARKRALFAGLRGRVLEIGAGNGVNLQYFGPEVEWTGYEPNRWLAKSIQVPPNGTLHVEPFRREIEEFDAVVCTLVLCSVEDPESVLKGLSQCLRPGGRLLFLEHVAAPQASGLRRMQDRWQPFWSFCAGGCHPNRETERLIEAAGFAVEKIERFDLNLGLATPHVAGEAIRIIDGVNNAPRQAL